MRPVVGPYRSSRFLLQRGQEGRGRAAGDRPQRAAGHASSCEGDPSWRPSCSTSWTGSIVGVRVVTQPGQAANASVRTSGGAPTIGRRRRARSRSRVESSSRRRTLPAAVRGRSSTITSSFGAAHGAMAVGDHLAELLERRSRRRPGTTQATTRSPHSGSGRFHTATSATPGCAIRMRSTTSGQTFSRPRGDDVVRCGPRPTSLPSATEPARHHRWRTRSASPSGPSTRPSSPSR